MSDSLRMLFLGVNYPPEATGIAPYSGAMTRGLSLRKHSVRVLTAHPHYPEWRIAPGYGQWSVNEHLGNVRVRRLRHFVPRNPSSIPRAIAEITFGVRTALSRWARPDVVVAVSPALISSAIALARARLGRRRTPFVVWVQDLYTIGLQETNQGAGVAARAVAAIEAWLLRRATHVVVIHPRFAERLAQDFSIPREKITVVRNWTHLPPFPAADIASVRAKYGWEDDETVVLHSGNMGVKQGLHHVIDAARLAHSRGERVRFVLVGNGAQREELERLAAAAPSTAQFLPPLPEREFTDALQAADVLLVNELPGVAEMAVPSKLTSYFAAGRPILAATDAHGITADEVRAAEAGVVVEPGDGDALLEGAQRLNADSVLATGYGANGRRYKQTVLDETFAIDRFDSLLADLTAAARTARKTHPRSTT